jgi:hypothetical protein
MHFDFNDESCFEQDPKSLSIRKADAARWEGINIETLGVPIFAWFEFIEIAEESR